MVLGVVAVTQVKTFMSGATGDVEPQNVVVIPGEDGKSATITWISDKESIAKIEYGTTAASLVLMSAEASAMTNHRLELSSLRPATTYYYRIRIGEDIFENGGIPYSFKTKSDAAALITPVVTPVTTTTTTTTTDTNINKPVVICDSKTDYNKDGVVNTSDLLTCRKNGGTVSVSTNVVQATTSGIPVIDCKGIISDYNSDGVINTADRLNCLQSQGQ